MTTTTLRIQQVLYDKIVKKAQEERRSINAEIQYIIEKYIEMTTWYKRK